MLLITHDGAELNILGNITWVGVVNDILPELPTGKLSSAKEKVTADDLPTIEESDTIEQVI